MTTGIIHDQTLEKQIEKQMGCMAGFLQIFDRNQILNGKRLYATKRLPPSPVSCRFPSLSLHLFFFFFYLFIYFVLLGVRCILTDSVLLGLSGGGCIGVGVI